MDEAQWATLLDRDVGIANPTANEVDNTMRWMTAEEPTPNWFDRNNPLNASVGTGTVDGTGSYPDLTTGARYTAGMINQSNMAGIRQALVSDASPADFSAAVVASPWASSHYAQPGHAPDPGHISAIPVPSGTTPAPSGTAGAGTVTTVPAGAGGSSGTGSSSGGGGLLSSVAGVVGGGIFGGLADSLLGVGATLVLLSGGAVLVVLGVQKTANPQRKVTQTLRDAKNNASSSIFAAAAA